jgi:hypothetical protein
MTESYVSRILTGVFLTLNDASGKPYISFAGGKPANVAVPNTAFTPPANRRFFVLSFLPGEPEPAGMGTYAENRWSGVFQIDVYSPAGGGEDEVNARYEALSELFGRGECFDGVVIRKVYCPLRETDNGLGAYRAAVRVEWTCDLPK